MQYILIAYLIPNSLYFLLYYTRTKCAEVPITFSHVQVFATPWTAAHSAPRSMGFSRQEHWSGFPFPSPGDLPDPGIEPASLMSPALTGRFFPTSTTWEAHTYTIPT